MATAPRRLSEDIQAVQELFATRAVRIREILALMHGRAYLFLLIILSIPFCTPIPLPGLSTPFGMIVAFIGLRLALRQQPWLPDRLLDTTLPASFFPQVFAAAKRIVLGIEYVLEPRMTFLADYLVLHHFYGTMICTCGLLLLLPLPIPFSNLFPALTVILLSAGMIEKDGYMLLAGAVLFLATVAFFVMLGIGGYALVESAKEWILETFFSSSSPLPKPM